ncbi:hypothetical protein BCR41DRAFT_372216 [Lobosporangium transversale]|uniref:Uncharacterized protein n=1 Tax=Lobosporangium transversale TaxID=64571 RepID=A0A1Y2GHW8_9FUNG|nr:hypothetical protein BCR41DRAFT_372216 [Lobosporangium transversale]ORZ11399.1 hypothetical protein BCR41DRAFT_372216 [Lobosporangium transversale]|eukprot:XP_021879714.1 hypothetical protein BCR41DRAFT_372216 [Lobosporangium transversale]
MSQFTHSYRIVSPSDMAMPSISSTSTLPSSLPLPPAYAKENNITADSLPDTTMPLVEDPFTANIIHDTSDCTLVQTMAMVAEAGADAGAAVSARSSTPVLHSTSSVVKPSFSSSSSSSSSSTSASVCSATAPTIYAPTTIRPGSGPSMSLGQRSVIRPSIDIPQPQAPIGLHHALDSTYPATPNAKPAATTARILPRSIESCVQDTLAKDPQLPSGSSTPYLGPGSNGHRRIMTPTSRLAETAVGVREVSKKIGK